MNDPRDIENLSAAEHSSWSGWTKWMLDKLYGDLSGVISQEEFESLTSVKRWRRQISTPYENLPEHEKESDRAVAREKLFPYRGQTQLMRASVEILVWGPGVLPTNEPKLLTVTNRRWGGFSCPGGKVEMGERLIDAARRELKEETGCEAVSIEPFIGGIHWDDPKDQGFPWFCMSYFVDIGDQVPSKQKEGTEIGWHTPTQLVHESIYPDWYRYLLNQMNG